MSNPEDLRASNGEVVRRLDLDRAAGTPGKFTQSDPRVAGYEGVELARAALAGDQAALDEFHELAGLVLPGVTEHAEGDAVRLVFSGVCDETGGDASVPRHVVFQAMNEGGHSCTAIDTAEIVEWIFSPEGLAALKRRGVSVPGEKLKFGALERGERFICWPVPGDNAGHGGYLGAQRLFVKTGELTADNGSGVESSMNAQMDVIKVLLR